MSLSTNQPNRRSSPARTHVREERATGTTASRERTSEHWVDGNGNGDENEDTTTAIDALDGPPDRYRLIVPISGAIDASDAERLVRTAAPIAGEREGEILFVGLVLVPEQATLNQLPTDHPRYEAVLDATARARHAARGMGVPARSVICKSHRKASAVLGMIEKYDGDGVSVTLLPGSSQRRRLLTGSAVEKIVARAGCDVFIEKPATGSDSDTTPPKRVLLAVAGGPHSGLAAETARRLALSSGARVDIVHFLADGATSNTESGIGDGTGTETGPDSGVELERAWNIVRVAERALCDVSRVESDVSRTDRVAEALVARSSEYDVTVLGAPTRGLLTQFVFGTVPASVERRVEGRIVMVKRNTGKTSVYDRWIAGDGTEITDGVGIPGRSPPRS